MIHSVLYHTSFLYEIRLFSHHHFRYGMSCVPPEEAGDAEPWVARAQMGSACVALLREAQGQMRI